MAAPWDPACPRDGCIARGQFGRPPRCKFCDDGGPLDRAPSSSAVGVAESRVRVARAAARADAARTLRDLLDARRARDLIAGFARRDAGDARMDAHWEREAMLAESSIRRNRALVARAAARGEYA